MQPMHIKEVTYVASTDENSVVEILQAMQRERATGSVKISFHQGGISREVLVSKKVSNGGKNGVSLDTLAAVCSTSELGRP